jgi:hypothetical protein
MGFYTTDSVLDPVISRPKSRAGGASTLPETRARRFAWAPPEPRPTPVTTTLETASGIVGWLSNDPIGISGGLNQYVFCGNDPVNNRDPMGLDWLDGAANFSAGAADVLSFGLTRVIRNSFPEFYRQDYNSGAYSVGEWSGVGLSIAIGGASGAKAAGTKAAGKQFSHWIPDRALKQTSSKWIRNTFGRSPFNGNYVSAQRHYLHDPYSYFRGWRDFGPKWNPFLQQLDRIPYLYRGAAVGGLLGGGSMAANEFFTDDTANDDCK